MENDNDLKKKQLSSLYGKMSVPAASENGEDKSYEGGLVFKGAKYDIYEKAKEKLKEAEILEL